jgi:hypothetical protein
MTATTGNEARDAELPWHRASAEDVAAGLEVDLHRGLGREAAAARLRSGGPNQLIEPPRRSPLRMLLSQFTDFMILVLLAAALISGIVGSLHDATAIIVIVALNAVVGAVQEYRADRAVAALRSMIRPEARLLREGEVRSVPAREVVVGDVVLLEAGDVVPADLRLVECLDLEIDEAPLTGESLPVAKTTRALEAEQAPLGDRVNMAYKGTLTARGRGRGVVVATGMRTEFGRIAALMAEAEPLETPLQRRLARFGRRLAVVVLCICALILGSGLLRGEPLLLMFLTAVSLAVAAIPEALPAVVTVSLAIGARKMIRRRALVRRLPAVEALGSVTTICADKTGTLTQNRMAVESILVDGRLEPGIPAAAAEGWPWRRLGQGLALCNDIASPSAPDAEPLAGDPTELALYRAAQEAGFHKQALLDELPLGAELPFDPERKRMSTLHRCPDGALIFTKGAPEAVLTVCTGQATGSGEASLDPDAWLERAEGLASQGYRVLALACRETGTFPETPGVAEVERSLTLLGLVALLDPPREEAAAAVSDCRSAGITPVMITGDHPGTALAIAQRLGLVSGESRVVTGSELTRIPMDQLERQVEEIRIYARVGPEQTGAEARRHRGGHGAEGHRRGPGSGRHGADGRRLRHDRRSGPGRSAHLRQHPEVHQVHHDQQLRRDLDAPPGALSRPSDSAAADPHPLDQPGHRRAAGTRLLRGTRRGGHHEAAAASTSREDLRRGHVAAHARDRPADRWALDPLAGVGTGPGLDQLADARLQRAHLLPARARPRDPLRERADPEHRPVQQSLPARRRGADGGPPARGDLPPDLPVRLQDPAADCVGAAALHGPAAGRLRGGGHREEPDAPRNPLPESRRREPGDRLLSARHRRDRGMRGSRVGIDFVLPGR